MDAGGVVNALEKLGTTARWPRKSDMPNSEKDTTKWSNYHGDHGHRTEDCNALKKEVAWLLKKGYLEHLMGKKGQQENKFGPSQQQPRPPPEPTHDKVINSISGGSEICGVTYSAAKRFAREGSKAVPKQYRSAKEKKLRNMTISFDEEDGDEEADHHDGLVVSLTISNSLMKRVLIDNGSSANIIFKSALESMGLQEADILKKATVLFIFNGEPATTLGEIILPTYAKGVNLQTKFNGVDSPQHIISLWGHHGFIKCELCHQTIIKLSNSLPNGECKKSRAIASWQENVIAYPSKQRKSPASNYSKVQCQLNQ
ncbi:uncharacterized protein LOC104893348 [Beta vulgaris subsp. vulgaris]|uniref:uncharacterized protein LOC104893348 n=1 Tax=Beta vulgaris subsp. vulgaris TaxID=3555 RepID=UPI00053F47D5|nr:uncharacterized protein LOC104893348 [Beta vulgaris subsp. vulgaris]